MKAYPLLALIALLPLHTRAEEGMWTFNNFPSAKVKAAYGFEPSQQWLDHIRLSSARLAQGCSSSFISPNGLVLTNHHCAQACIAQLSTKEDDLMAKGFSAATQADEKKCPALELNQLVEITDVTQRVQAGTKNLDGEAFSKARNAEYAKIEKECQGEGDANRCDVVALYSGGVYNLYKYRRYQDVRLVFAPEFDIAFFGGDPDNFEFPRYTLDMSLLRIYENGQPAKTPHYLKWAPQGLKEGDLTFVSGHPGSTQRMKTISELKYLRDFDLPRYLFDLHEYRGMLAEYGQRGPEQLRTSNSDLFGVENSIKALNGEWEALVDEKFFAQKIQQENDFRKRIAANSKWKAEYAKLWDEDTALVEKQRQFDIQSGPLNLLMTRSRLFQNAVRLIRFAQELPKPDADRIPGYNESRLPAAKQALFSTAPIYKELETEKLTYALTKMRERLGPDNPTVKSLLGRKSPREVATSVIAGTALDQVDVRKKLFEGGQAAIDASTDPLIQFAKVFEPIQREWILKSEKEINPEATRISEALAKARFDAYGTSIYPDATFSLRLTFGSATGYIEDGREVRPFTIIGGAFERHTGAEPFALPKSWLDNKDKLDLTTPMNFVSTNDIIGGNSGSPVINKNGELVGLIFDGNIQSLGGAFGFDAKVNRAISVDSRVMKEALTKIYKTQRLLDEIAAAGK